MEAPEKIFLPIVNMGVEEGECTAPIWWNKDKAAEHSEVVKAIEYIRKDLLLEWAKEELETRRNTGDDYCLPAIVALNDLIDKLNSL